MIYLLSILSLFVYLLLFYNLYRKKQRIKKLQAEKQLQEHTCIELKAKLATFETSQTTLESIREEVICLRIREKELEVNASLQKEAAEEKLKLISSGQEKLKEMFKALSSDALKQSNESFLQLAKESLQSFQEKAKGDLDKRQESIDKIVTPVKETLHKLDEGMRSLEKERKGQHESLKTQLNAIAESEKDLRKETATLAQAFRIPIVRGRWGEMQLRRVVELAGMVNRCDFFEQETASSGHVRPDLVIRLPGGKQVIVDAKTPCIAYLEAMQTQVVEEKYKKLKLHASHVRKHVTALGKKAYWEKFHPTPEFVVVFIPSDNFFSSALEFDPSLIEVGIEEGVIIATPTTLIGLLRAIAYGWKQEKLSVHAEEVSILGHELYKRITDMGKHWNKLGRTLSSSVEAYNQAVGSLETRVLASARKFKQLGAASETIDLDPIDPIERVPRKVQAAEMKKL